MAELDIEKRILAEIEGAAALKKSEAAPEPFHFYLYSALAIFFAIVAVRRNWSKIQAEWSRRGISLVLAIVAIAVKLSCGVAHFLSAAAGQDALLLAYLKVSEDDSGWVWSSMLLGWAVTVAYAAPSLAPDVSGFDFFIIFAMGETVTFSAALSLIFLSARRPPCLDGKPVSFNSAMLLLAGHTATLGIRFASETQENFTVTLAMLHVVILMPAIAFRDGRIPLWIFLGAAALLSMCQHFCALGMAFIAAPSVWVIPSLLLRAPGKNFCELAVGVDAAFAHFQGQFFFGHDWWQILDDTFLALLVSPGAVFAWRLLRLLLTRDVAQPRSSHVGDNSNAKKSD